MSSETPYAIGIDVATHYLDEESSPEDSRYVFAYTIRIANTGSVPAKLLTRHWIITDANGRTEEVKGAGVVGKQPLLRQGERFEYTSGVPLKTPSGLMRGTYQMVTEDGEDFDAEVPAFSLDAPSMKRVVH